MPEILQTITGAECVISVSTALAQLERESSANSRYGGADEPENYSYFHSSVLPSVSLSAYMDVLHRSCRCGRDGVVMGIVLVYKYCEAVSMKPSALSVHRLCLTGVLLACKTHHDKHCSNRAFAEAGGLTLSELNQLESRMARALGFNLTITLEDISAVGAGRWPLAEACSSRVAAAAAEEIRLDAAPCLLPQDTNRSPQPTTEKITTSATAKLHDSYELPTPDNSPTDSPQVVLMRE